MEAIPLPRLWRAAAPLILASRSQSRRALLSAAGLDAESVSPDVDEREVENRYLAGGGALGTVALELAQAKALAVSAMRPDAYCIGADQTLTLEGRILHKSSDFAEAAQTLAALSGKTHRLTSAFCVARAGQPLVVHGVLPCSLLDVGGQVSLAAWKKDTTPGWFFLDARDCQRRP